MTESEINKMLAQSRADALRPYHIVAALIGGASLLFGLLGVLVGWP